MPTLGRGESGATRRRRFGPWRPSVVIYDECHHAPAPSGRAVLEWAGSWESTRTVGVTATLVRGDKRKPSEVWQEVAYERDIAWAVTNDWLVAPRGRVVVADHVDLKSAKMNSRGTDYADGELGEMVSQDVDQIVKAWLEHAADRITVAFTPTVAAAEALREEFEAQGVAAECVFGNTPAAVRGNVERGTGIYGRLFRGETRVLCGVMVASEGWDCPPVSCVLMARPTKLRGLYTQIVGRGLRPYPGKTDCLVLDVVGASRGQSLVGLTDLSEAFVRDTSELDLLPCEACGGFRPRQLEVAPELGEECSCTPEPAAGDGPVAGPRRLQGPARYEDIPLLPDPRAKHRWLRSRRGVPFLIGSLPWCANRAGIVYPDTGHADSPTWTPGHVAVRGRTSWERLDDAPLSFAEAQERVQAWAGPSPRVPSGPAPEWLVGKAATLGVEQAWRLDRRALQDAIDIARVSAVVDR